jgi:S1-C subfamily serine protease
MRRFQALLMAAGLAAAPLSAAAGPSNDPRTPADTYERFEWSTSKGRLGAMVMSLTPELREHFGAAADRGVLVARVEPGTPAKAAGLAVGDVIVEVGTKPVDGAMDVLAALSTVRKGQSVALHVVRDGKAHTLQATLTDDPSRSQGAQGWQFMQPDGRLRSPFDDAWFERFRELMRPAPPDHTSLRS